MLFRSYQPMDHNSHGCSRSRFHGSRSGIPCIYQQTPRWLCRIHSYDRPVLLSFHTILGPSLQPRRNPGLACRLTSNLLLYLLTVFQLIGTMASFCAWIDNNQDNCSLERMLEFMRIDHEPSPTDGGKPPAYWPSSGDLRVEKLSARYSNGLFYSTSVLTVFKMTLRQTLRRYCITYPSLWSPGNVSASVSCQNIWHIMGGMLMHCIHS